MHFTHDADYHFYYMGEREPHARTYHELVTDWHPHMIAIDTETVSLDDTSLLGIGIAFSPNEAMYFELRPHVCPVIPRHLLTDDSITKILHNALFDLFVLRPYHVDYSNIKDTHIMALLTGSVKNTLEDLAPLVNKEVHSVSELLGQVGEVTTTKKKLIKVEMDDGSTVGIYDDVEVPSKRAKTMLDLKPADVARKCMQDAMATFALYYYYAPKIDTAYFDIEMQASSILEKMSQQGMKIDQEARAKIEQTVQADVDFYKGVCEQQGFRVSSPVDVGNWLANKGLYAGFRKPPVNRKSGKLKTDEDTLKKIDHPIIPIILGYREKSKLLSTYILPYAGEERAYTRFHSEARTGRPSSTDRNMQNIPSFMRNILIPDNGEWTDGDFSQTELRVLAYLSGDKNMQYIYSLPEGDPKADIHQATADFMHIARKIAKTVNFGMVYGATEQTLMESAEITDIEVARKLKQGWFEAYPEAAAWIREQQYHAVHQKAVARTLFGRDLPIVADWEGDEGGIGRKAINYPIQGCIPGDNRILVKNVGYIPIKELCGQTVELWDGDKYVYGSIICSGLKAEVLIRLANKQEISCSPEHKFLVMSSNGNKSWKTALELIEKTGLNLCITEDTDNPDGIMRVKETENTRHWKAPKGVANTNLISWNMINNPYQLGIVLGRLASDGTINQDRALTWFIAEHEKKILPYLRNILNVFPVKERQIVKEGYNSIMYTLQINSVMLTRQTISMDLKHKIPSIAWNNKELLRGFLCGMFDGDGGISGNGIVLTFGEPSLDTQYPEDIQQALLLFGIRSTVERTSYCAHVRIRTRDNKLFKDRIGFINFDKQQSIDEHTSVKHGWKSERIRSAEITGNIMTMYDVINTESGKFMTEGYITHNSAAELLKRALIICKDFDLTLQVHDEIIVDGRVELPIDAISHIAPFHTPFKVKYLSRWE